MKPLRRRTTPATDRAWRAPGRLLHVLPAIAALVILVTTGAAAQIALSDVHGIVGKEVALPIRFLGPLDSLDTVSIRGSFQLGNPTVFYPERFVAAGGDSVLDYDITRLTDSTYTFSVTLQVRGGERPSLDTVAYLAGEALAGYDSTTLVSFSDLLVNDVAAGGVAGRITTTSIGTPLPYVRYATLEQNYPNPVLRGMKTTWTYRIDRESVVRFIIYNVTGEEVVVMEEGVRRPGVHVISLVPGYDVSVGVYWARLHTNTGDAYQPMHVLR